MRCITALAGFLAAREAPRFRPATGGAPAWRGWQSLFCLIWLAAATLTRYCSLASLIATTPFILWWLGELPEAQLVAVLTGLLWIMHWPNISRLLAGTENKIGKPTASLKREPALSAVLAGDDPEAIVLDFMQPQRAGGGFGAFIGRQG